MISIAFQFLAGRYHATPWGRHVNEGAVEWPPSPWRILRALVATWKRTLPDLAESDVKPILEILAAEPPEFVLPPASTGHTRHYMPWFKKGPDDRTKVFDTFVAVAREPNETGSGFWPAALIARWPNASLDGTHRQVLERILNNLNTLGRSESWCHAKLLSDDEATTCFENSATGSLSVPLNGTDPPQDAEIVRLLCPDPETAFSDDSVVTITKKTTGRGKNKQTIESRSTIYDPSWNLCMETLQLHKERWSDPPGSRWVQYTRPRDCFKVEPVFRSRVQRPAEQRPQVVRFALDSTVLPLITQTLPVAESARRALLYRLATVRGRRQYGAGWHREKHKAGQQPLSLGGALSGKDDHGRHLTGHHHAYFLPTDEDGDGRLDHLTIVARGGFDSEEMQAVDRLREIRPWGRDNASHPLRVLLLGFGRLDEYQPAPLRPSHVWVSATPYVATRHAKTRGRHRIDLRSPHQRADFLITDLRRQLRVLHADLDEDAIAAAQITPQWDDIGIFHLHTRGGRGHLRPIQFKRFRSKPGDDGGRRLAGAFRIEFRQAVAGPIAIGHSAHFGMGQFVPEKET